MEHKAYYMDNFKTIRATKKAYMLTLILESHNVLKPCFKIICRIKYNLTNAMYGIKFKWHVLRVIIERFLENNI